MPEPLTAPPPAPPAPSTSAPPSPPPATPKAPAPKPQPNKGTPPPPPRGEIKIPAAPAAGGKPAAPPGPTDHWKDAFDRLDDFASPNPDTTKPSDPKPPADPKADDEPKGEVEADPNTPPPADPAKPNLETKGGKVSPWKLVDHWKAQYATLQKEVAELKTKPAELPKDVTETLTAMQKRNQELEDEIRYVNYAKTPEFVDKYQKPYEDAWRTAISGLKGLSVQITNAAGETDSRELTAQDIAVFANMPPEAARKAIKASITDPFEASEVRSHVENIRRLNDAQSKALDEAKTNGAERERQRLEEQNRHQAVVKKELNEIWQQYNKELTEKYDFLRPIDGQEGHNSALERGKAFVMDALRSNPSDPKLTKEERAEVVKKHEALRLRAIGYSVLLHERKALKAQLEEAKNALKAYEFSEPDGGNGDGGKGGGGKPSGDLMEEALKGLRGLAA